MTIEQRLNRLETQNRRLRFGGMFLLLGIGAMFLMGNAKGVPEEIKAHSFIVVDDSGATRAELGLKKNQVRLVLHASERPHAAVLFAEEHGGSLHLASGMDTAMLSANALVLIDAATNRIQKVP